jgi:hypothetical protein
VCWTPGSVGPDAARTGRSDGALIWAQPARPGETAPAGRHGHTMAMAMAPARGRVRARPPPAPGGCLRPAPRARSAPPAPDRRRRGGAPDAACPRGPRVARSSRLPRCPFACTLAHREYDTRRREHRPGAGCARSARQEEGHRTLAGGACTGDHPEPTARRAAWRPPPAHAARRTAPLPVGQTQGRAPAPGRGGWGPGRHRQRGEGRIGAAGRASSSGAPPGGPHKYTPQVEEGKRAWRISPVRRGDAARVKPRFECTGGLRDCVIAVGSQRRWPPRLVRARRLTRGGDTPPGRRRGRSRGGPSR